MGASKKLRRSVLSRRLVAGLAGSPQSSRGRRSVNAVFVSSRLKPANSRPYKLQTLCAHVRRSSRSKDKKKMACNRAAKSGFAAEAQRKVRRPRKKDFLMRVRWHFCHPDLVNHFTLLPTLTPGYVDSTYWGCISAGRRRAALFVVRIREYAFVGLWYLPQLTGPMKADIALKYLSMKR